MKSSSYHKSKTKMWVRISKDEFLTSHNFHSTYCTFYDLTLLCSRFAGGRNFVAQNLSGSGRTDSVTIDRDSKIRLLSAGIAQGQRNR